MLSSPRVGGHIAGAINNKSPNIIREKMAKLWETVGVWGVRFHKTSDGDEETERTKTDKDATAAEKVA